MTILDIIDAERQEKAEEVRRVTESAVARSDAHANEDWKDFATCLLSTLAQVQAEVTADDLWDAMLAEPDAPTTHDNSALGPVFRKVARLGLIEFSGRFTESRRPERHRAAVRVWRSLVFKGARYDD